MTGAAWVFPGQGSQAAGMGLDIYSRFPSARAVYEEADAALGFPLSRLCFDGPEERLTRTVNVQPAILVTSIAYLRAAQESGAELPAADFMAGHSLGQYSALVAAGSLKLADAVRLVRERGRLMYEAGLQRPGGMLAVIGSDEEAVGSLCSTAGVQISNINAPGQVVVSGPLEALDEFKKEAVRMGMRRIIPLRVSGAFHSQLMAPAVEGLRKAVEQCDFSRASVPVVSNVTGEPLTGPGDIKKDLVDQLTACVLWQRSVENMVKSGVTAFYEIGHGQVLGGLIRRISPDAGILHVTEQVQQVTGR